MMLTGLRRGEVASLTVNAICLDENNPFVQVEGKHAKSGRAATLPLRKNLADDLRKHVARLAEDAGQGLPDTPLFNAGQSFLRTFNLDLAAAGIAKRDAQGRTVDVHGMRHTFATLLARKGVTSSVAQKLMRHSDIRLTMNKRTPAMLLGTQALGRTPGASFVSACGRRSGGGSRRPDSGKPMRKTRRHPGTFLTPRSLAAVTATTAARTDANAPILEASCNGPGSKATVATNRATVKPIPAAQPITSNVRQERPCGSDSLRTVRANSPPRKTPAGLPSRRPRSTR